MKQNIAKANLQCLIHITVQHMINLFQQSMIMRNNYDDVVVGAVHCAHWFGGQGETEVDW